MRKRFVYKKSSASSPSQSCVEVAMNVVGVRAIRDSKNPQGPHLEIDPPSFTAFLGAVKAGRLNR